MSSRPTPSTTQQARNKDTAARFIHGFNDDDWDTVREVVAPEFVFHHPVGGTVEAGPEGMVSAWSGFKTLSPDSWHPIPIMIAEDDHVAVLLPTYGTFSGHGEHAPPPTGGRLDYGMVNMVRFEEDQLAEMWFGMDSLVEMQQMGVAPTAPTPELSAAAQGNLDAFDKSAVGTDGVFDTVAAFGDVVVAMGPPQADPATSVRRVDIFRIVDGVPIAVHHDEFATKPPYAGDPQADTAASRDIVERWIAEVLNAHDTGAIDEIAGDHLLIHPTAMPCEAAFYGPHGAVDWLNEHWKAFDDLSITDHHTVACHDVVACRWTAQGTSNGEFMGFQPTGGAVSYTGVTMYRIQDGRIGEIWETRNTLAILHQLDPDIGSGGHHH